MPWLATYASPLGELAMLVDDVCLVELSLPGATSPDACAPGFRPASEGHPVVRLVASWLDAYFAGEDPDPDAVPLSAAGTPYQQRVWNRVKDIPYGEVASYGEIGATIDPPSTGHAVGGAVARCPFSLVVPCHRVIASDGTLGGFGGIEAMKARLLAFEGFDLGLIKGLRPDLQRGTEPLR